MIAFHWSNNEKEREGEQDTELTSLAAVGTRGVNKWNSTPLPVLFCPRIDNTYGGYVSYGQPIVPLYKNIREMVRENNACST